MSETTEWENNEEVRYLQEYLQIPSFHPNIDYEPCIDFLKRQATDLDLPVEIFYPKDIYNPVLIMTLVGTQPELPSILLSSHMDVVPVYEKSWTHPPFGAEIDKEGRIFARGSQYMKNIGIQYLAAIRALKKEGKLNFKRTIHLSFLPDEEVGGGRGMQPFVHTDDFKRLNIGFSLNGGMASPDEEYLVFNAERITWKIHFKISGKTGHTSLLQKNTPGEKIQYIVNKMNGRRAEEMQRLENDSKLKLGNVTTINLTLLSGGIQTNVLPALLIISFDVRLAIDQNHDVFEKQLIKWCEEAGGGIKIEYESKKPRVEPTKADDSNPYWISFNNAIDELGIKIDLRVFPVASDSRYLRMLNIPAIGFSPMNYTPVLFNGNDEYIKVETFLKGIEFYKVIISHLANT